jgi:hypothetical protein
MISIKNNKQWIHYLGLLFCLAFPSLAIFKKLGFPLLILYVAIAAILLGLLLRYVTKFFSTIQTKHLLYFLLFIFLILTGLYLTIHPLIDTAGFSLAGKSFGSSDADNATVDALTELTQGRYPYYAETFLGNPITPMPGALLMALPFFVLGDVAIQNIFWFAAFFIFVSFYCKNIQVATILCIAVLMLTPNFLYHVLQGTDYISNGIYLLIFSAGLLETARKKASMGYIVIWAILLGLGLSSRMNFILILPLMFFALIRLAGLPKTIIIMLIVGISFIGITLPFALYDFANFSPLHTSNKLNVNGETPWAPILIPLSGLILSTYFGLKHKAYSLLTFMRDVFWVQAYLIICGLALSSYAHSHIDLAYPHFALLFMFFGVFAFGIPLFNKKIKAQSDSQLDHGT